MSEPRLLACRSNGDIPSRVELMSLADDGYHVVLLLPSGTDKGPLIKALADSLPDYSVFDSGATREGQECVTVKKVLARSVISENEETFLAAIRQFTDTAVGLVTRLAVRLGRPMGSVSERWRFELGESASRGRLDDEWEYTFHGYECHFGSRKSGQDVDVRLQGWGDPKALLDPFFFAQFVRSTPSLSVVDVLLKDDYHDPSQVLKVLVEMGKL